MKFFIGYEQTGDREQLSLSYLEVLRLCKEKRAENDKCESCDAVKEMADYYFGGMEKLEEFIANEGKVPVKKDGVFGEPEWLKIMDVIKIAMENQQRMIELSRPIPKRGGVAELEAQRDALTDKMKRSEERIEQAQESIRKCIINASNETCTSCEKLRALIASEVAEYGANKLKLTRLENKLRILTDIANSKANPGGPAVVNEPTCADAMNALRNQVDQLHGGHAVVGDRGPEIVVKREDGRITFSTVNRPREGAEKPLSELEVLRTEVRTLWGIYEQIRNRIKELETSERNQRAHIGSLIDLVGRLEKQKANKFRYWF